ncbi:hypothetical protein DEU56DRAFT_838716 [Suillus clintonianus]|uniref:uncharacterized protein n=1 Tax=Suillus clintonianus TaxID=1904413 RepID=UPI001B886C61|nr:uncharacterized protein DEU56DRAFT_838716 [Suillus clintonianus]KAG2118319.1 hypothetical protein DEU56DRAFT_838716 [Suillus clintonianus]
MDFTHPHVLIVGAGPVGLVAALTLLQNGIPIRIIDKDPKPHIGQRATSHWLRTLELFNSLNIPEINNLGVLASPVRSYKSGTMESLIQPSNLPTMEPNPAVPFVRKTVVCSVLKSSCCSR